MYLINIQLTNFDGFFREDSTLKFHILFFCKLYLIYFKSKIYPHGRSLSLILSELAWNGKLSVN